MTLPWSDVCMGGLMLLMLTIMAKPMITAEDGQFIITKTLWHLCQICQKAYNITETIMAQNLQNIILFLKCLDVFVHCTKQLYKQLLCCPVGQWHLFQTFISLLEQEVKLEWDHKRE